MDNKLKILKNNADKNKQDESEKQPWYAKGLCFECTGCGQCCTGAPGFIWVSEEEIETIANFLKLSINEFTGRYLRRVKGRISLIELPKTFDCIFLKNKKCEIYPVRPTQCRTFPWWPQIMISEEEWKQTARLCEGIRSDAPVVSLETIDEQLNIQLDYNLSQE